MISLYRTLSTRYLSKRWFRAVLIVACIALGVATLVATRALSETMNKAGLQASNPLAGTADLLVTSLSVVSASAVGLARTLFGQCALLGAAALNPAFTVEFKPAGSSFVFSVVADLLSDLAKKVPVVIGKDLVEELGSLTRSVK